MPVSNANVHDEDTSDDNGSEAGDPEPAEFAAEVAGRSLGFRDVPRFGCLHDMSPFQYMFVDNKDYP